MPFFSARAANSVNRVGISCAQMMLSFFRFSWMKPFHSMKNFLSLSFTSLKSSILNFSNYFSTSPISSSLSSPSFSRSIFLENVGGVEVNFLFLYHSFLEFRENVVHYRFAPRLKLMPKLCGVVVHKSVCFGYCVYVALVRLVFFTNPTTKPLAITSSLYLSLYRSFSTIKAPNS